MWWAQAVLVADRMQHEILCVSIYLMVQKVSKKFFSRRVSWWDRIFKVRLRIKHHELVSGICSSSNSVLLELSWYSTFFWSNNQLSCYNVNSFPKPGSELGCSMLTSTTYCLSNDVSFETFLECFCLNHFSKMVLQKKQMRTYSVPKFRVRICVIDFTQVDKRCNSVFIPALIKTLKYWVKCSILEKCLFKWKTNKNIFYTFLECWSHFIIPILLHSRLEWVF